MPDNSVWNTAPGARGDANRAHEHGGGESADVNSFAGPKGEGQGEMGIGDGPVNRRPIERVSQDG